MPRYGVIADVHGNAEALFVALRCLDRASVDAILCAGDLVGFNADANRVVDEIERLEATCIAGNHDHMALDRLGYERCWYQASHAIERTKRTLSSSAREYLTRLPICRGDDGILLFHGSVDDVERYSRSSEDMRHNDALVGERAPSARVCFYGHTHRPGVHRVGADGSVELLGREGIVELDPEASGRWFVNPGSVDAARRSDGRAQLAIYDSDACTVELRRVGYAHERAERKARRQGYRVSVPTKLRHETLSLARRGAATVVGAARKARTERP